MTAETIARTIQLIVAPVVMVTAGAILSGGLLSHAGAINDRLRTLAHERLDVERIAGLNPAALRGVPFRPAAPPPEDGGPS